VSVSCCRLPRVEPWKGLRPHSIILVNCKPGCKPGFRPGLQPGFRQVRAGLRHAFDMPSTRFRLFCRKPGSEPVAALTQAVKPDMGSELRFLPTPPAFDATVRGVPVGMLLCRLVRKN